MLEIRIGVSVPRAEAMKKDGLEIPPLVLIRGLVDTGASSSAIDPSVIEILGIPPTGTIHVLTPSTGIISHECNQYDVQMIIDHPHIPFRLQAVSVSESVLSHLGFDALIGRDILKDCLFVYNGHEETFTLAY